MTRCVKLVAVVVAAVLLVPLAVKWVNALLVPVVVLVVLALVARVVWFYTHL